MNKTEAISLLGGSVSNAAREIGVSPQAISQWPAELPESLADRVLAAWARKNVKNLPAPMRKPRAAKAKEPAHA